MFKSGGEVPVRYVVLVREVMSRDVYRSYAPYACDPMLYYHTIIMPMSILKSQETGCVSTNSGITL